MSPRLNGGKRSNQDWGVKEKYMNFGFARLMQRLIMVSHSAMRLRDD